MTVVNSTIRATPNTRGHLIIPMTNKFPRSRFTITLEGNPYEFVIHWNETISAWYMNLRSITDSAIDFKGIRLVGGVNLLKPFAILELGALYMVDGEGLNEDPNYDDMGGRFRLYYVPTTDPDFIL